MKEKKRYFVLDTNVEKGSNAPLTPLHDFYSGDDESAALDEARDWLSQQSDALQERGHEIILVRWIDTLMYRQ